jgi:hypothetical protein
MVKGISGKKIGRHYEMPTLLFSNRNNLLPVRIFDIFVEDRFFSTIFTQNVLLSPCFSLNASDIERYSFYYSAFFLQKPCQRGKFCS